MSLQEVVCARPSPPVSSQSTPIIVCEAAPKSSLKLVCVMMPKKKKKIAAVSLKDHLPCRPGLSLYYGLFPQSVIIFYLTLGSAGSPAAPLQAHLGP